MNYWSVSKVKYRLHYAPEYSEYEMGREADPTPRVGKRIYRTRDAYFVTDALDNAWVAWMFKKLTAQEQKLLIELYIDGSEDLSFEKSGEWHISIVVSNELSQEVARRNNLSVKAMWAIANEALEKLVEYLNG